LREEGIGYHVSFPDLPGCNARGYDLDESVRNAKVALEIHLSSYIESDEEMPKPSIISETTENEHEFIRMIEAEEKNIRDILDSNFY
jgi:predicted RNase H-like HicB family nuclease